MGGDRLDWAAAGPCMIRFFKLLDRSDPLLLPPNCNRIDLACCCGFVTHLFRIIRKRMEKHLLGFGLLLAFSFVCEEIPSTNWNFHVCEEPPKHECSSTDKYK